MTSMIVKVFGQQIENSLTWGKNPRKNKTKHMGNLLKLLDAFFFSGEKFLGNSCDPGSPTGHHFL